MFKLVCLLLHQSIWEEIDDGTKLCPKCDEVFRHPSRMLDSPVYRKYHKPV